MELFNWFKELTLAEDGRVYDLLGVKFDSYAGESFYQDKMGAVIDELREKGLLKLDSGAYIVDLAPYDMPPCLILRSDGATLYATRDLAAAIYRKKTYDFAKSLYVVAYQQNLHFRQLFKVLELMGLDWVKDCEHVNFGMVSMEEGTLSTREGKVVFLEEVLNASVEKTLEIIKDKSPDLEDKETVARQVGVGALIWGALYNSRIKDIVFSWDKALNFDGETGPYAQYTYARCCSVLSKAEGFDQSGVDWSRLTDPASQSLVKAIGALPDAIGEAASRNEPYLVSRAVIAVCSAFNKFYYENRIMDDDPSIRNARLALTSAARTAVKTGLYLVGLEAPERM
jgi:arginyl-tRNA synthetase